MLVSSSRYPPFENSPDRGPIARQAVGSCSHEDQALALTRTWVREKRAHPALSEFAAFTFLWAPSLSLACTLLREFKNIQTERTHTFSSSSPANRKNPPRAPHRVVGFRPPNHHTLDETGIGAEIVSGRFLTLIEVELEVEARRSMGDMKT